MLSLWSVVKLRTDDVHIGVIEYSRDFFSFGLIVRLVFCALMLFFEQKGFADSSKKQAVGKRFHNCIIKTGQSFEPKYETYEEFKF